MGAGSQREMILGVLPVPTWLMPSLLFALAMYGALEAYIALNPHPHELARKVKRQLIRSVRWVYGVLSPPVKHSWQWLCTDERPRYWVMFLVGICLSWLFVMFWFHLEFMFRKMHVLVVQVEYNQNTTLKLLGDRFREAFQKSPHNSMLVEGLHIGNGWERVVWPWWYCPFFERFFASFTTQWEYVTDLSAAAWFCGWFGVTLLKCFVPGFKPHCKLCKEGQDGVHTLCINAQRQTANSKVLHITPGGWPDAPVPPQCPQASPGGPIGSP